MFTAQSKLEFRQEPGLETRSIVESQCVTRYDGSHRAVFHICRRVWKVDISSSIEIVLYLRHSANALRRKGISV